MKLANKRTPHMVFEQLPAMEGIVQNISTQNDPTDGPYQDPGRF